MKIVDRVYLGSPEHRSPSAQALPKSEYPRSFSPSATQLENGDVSVEEVGEQDGHRDLSGGADGEPPTRPVRCTAACWAAGGAAFDPAEAGSIEATERDESGWPYLQHRGGPKGFVRVLDEHTLGFADYRGNRQYISVGNVAKDDRVALIFRGLPQSRPAEAARARVPAS